MSHASGEVASTVGLLAALAAQSVKVAASLGTSPSSEYEMFGATDVPGGKPPLQPLPAGAAV